MSTEIKEMIVTAVTEVSNKLCQLVLDFEGSVILEKDTNPNIDRKDAYENAGLVIPRVFIELEEELSHQYLGLFQRNVNLKYRQLKKLLTAFFLGSMSMRQEIDEVFANNTVYDFLVEMGGEFEYITVLVDVYLTHFKGKNCNKTTFQDVFVETINNYTDEREPDLAMLADTLEEFLIENLQSILIDAFSAYEQVGYEYAVLTAGFNANDNENEPVSAS